MSRIAWNTSGSRVYEAGVDRGVLYIGTSAGVPWVGLVSVDENPDGGETKAYYIDGEKYLNISSSDEFGASITAFTYPVEFGACDGTARVRPGVFFGQQGRKPFGFSYRTKVGNDSAGTEFAYKIHLVYNALAAPASRSLSTFSDSVEAADFSWDISTKNRRVAGYASTAHVIIDSRYTHPFTMAALEDILYGSDTGVARLLTPEEIVTIYDVPVVWEVVDNLDGSFDISGPDDNVRDIGLEQFILSHPSVSPVVGETFTITY